jgi:FkbM family methyltransferase
MSQTAKEVDYRGFRWDLRLPSNIDTEIAEGRDWEPVITKWVEQHVKPAMIVLDVGANIGWFTLIMSRLVGTTGCVVAVEPCTAFLERLHWHLMHNACDNVQVWPSALGPTWEPRYIVQDGGPYHSTARIVEPPFGDGVELVHCSALDTQWDYGRLDLIKIDVDGYEMPMLQGAEQTIRKFRPRILIEVPNIEPAKLLAEWGYTFIWERGNAPMTVDDIQRTLSPSLPTLNLMGVYDA